MIISILGWIVIVVVAIFIVLCLVGLFIRRKESRRLKVVTEGKAQFASRLNDASYWLNSDERKPYGELLTFIYGYFKTYGAVREEAIRDKVDEIIEKQKQSI